MDSQTIIDMQQPTATCCVCGVEDLSKWGLPISMATGLIVGNDFEGDWAAKPACRNCWAKHECGELVEVDPN